MTDGCYKKVPVDEKDAKQDVLLSYGYGVRHVQALLMFFSLSIGYMARAHLGVTIVAMTSPARILHNDPGPVLRGTVDKDLPYNISTLQNKTLSLCGSQCVTNMTEIIEEKLNIYKQYSWTKSIQEMVLGAFFVGYGIMMFPIGLVCQKWGGKIPLQIALGVNAVISILTPWITAWGNWKALCVCRVIQGMSQAGYYPGMHTLLARWAPLGERGSLSSYVYTGSLLGTVLAFQVGGILGESQWGWPSTCWLAGLLCLVAFTLLTIFSSASPSEHKTISDDEKNYILGRIDDGVKKKLNMPWKSILMSKHVWASFAGHVGSGVSFVFYFTQVPTYMHSILKVNIKSSGLLSSLPYIGSFFSVMFSGYFSDFLINKKIVSLRNARVIANSIGSVIPAICTAAVSFTTNVPLAVSCFVVSLMTHGLVHTGWMVNYMDLAPNFSGGLMAIGNTLTNAVVILLPVLVSKIVTDVTNVYQWRIMMFVMVGLVLITNLIFVVFMSADTQAWNDNKEIEEESQNNSKQMEVEKSQNS